MLWTQAELDRIRLDLANALRAVIAALGRGRP